MPYAYTQRDLLEDPPLHYMYSQFEGARFLGDYIVSRTRARRKLAAVKERSYSPSGEVPILENTPEIMTEEVLSRLVSAVKCGAPAAAQIRNWIDLFSRKFEASKRLRRVYGPQFRPMDRTPVKRTAYARLAFLVASAISGQSDLRLINTLLKLNDLVLSGPQDDDVAPLMAIAIEREVACIREIAAGLNVSLAEQTAC